MCINACFILLLKDVSVGCPFSPVDTDSSSMLEMFEVFGMAAESDPCLTAINEGSQNMGPFKCGVTKKGSRFGNFSVTEVHGPTLLPLRMGDVKRPETNMYVLKYTRD